MAKGVISEKEWEQGAASEGSPEKAAKVLAFLETLGTGAATMEALRKGCGLKWPYSTVQALVKQGSVERKKVGKAMYFRLKGRKARST